LDRAAQAQRDAQAEAFPADERTVLHDALEELEKAIVLDPYGPALWNSRSGGATCSAGMRNPLTMPTARSCCDLTVTPGPGSTGFLARSIGQKREALAAAQEALDQANAWGSEYSDAVSTAQQLLVQIHHTCASPSEDELVATARSIVEPRWRQVQNPS